MSEKRGDLHAVVMAGGSGTRFWPMSRQNRPKQLLSLAGPRTLIQQAVDRIEPVVLSERVWVTTTAELADEVRRQLPQLAADSIIVEPCARDTAACVGLAATIVQQVDADAMLVVMPSDHVIEPDADFRGCVEHAARLVGNEPTRFVTFGIRPTRPATGYGYIERGALIEEFDATTCGAELVVSTPAFQALRFCEKPPLAVAEQYVASGDFYWNSGIFVWRADAVLEALRESRPAMVASLARIATAWNGPDRDRVLAAEYAALERISIDYAVMQPAGKAGRVVVIEAGFRWDDLGSWSALERNRATPEGGNTEIGAHCGIDTRGSIIVSDPGRLIATLGVENLIIVQAGDVTLVADKRCEESVKQLTELLRNRGLERYL